MKPSERAHQLFDRGFTPSQVAEKLVNEYPQYKEDNKEEV